MQDAATERETGGGSQAQMQMRVGGGSEQKHTRRQAAHRRISAPHLAAGIVLLGGVLRLYHMNALSLWVDEGLTVIDARLPWPTVLGFGRIYSPHPPLYFALVKLLSSLCSELVAGRLLSVVAGTLTIAVVYRLVAGLVHPAAGLVAGLVLAVSPLHIWYSQEARPYALAVLLVALSYLALMEVIHDGHRAWTLVYGLSLAGALYSETSAVFALAPQAVLLALACKRIGRRIYVVLGAASAATLAYVPWVPRLLAVAGPTSAQAQFALTPGKVAGSLLSVASLAADEAVFAGSRLPPWDLWPHAQELLLFSITPIMALGTVALARRSRYALGVAVALGIGTIAVAVTVSLVYPSYAERTILYAVLGWAVLIGAAPFVAPLPRWFAIGGRLSIAAVLVLSTLTLDAQYSDAYKQEWRALAADTAVAARFGWPVLTYPTVAGTLIGLYQPRALDQDHVALDDGANLPSPPRAPHRQNDVLWVAYIDGSGAERLQAQLAGRGYARLMHTYYPYPLYLDLYTLPEARLGDEVPISIGDQPAGIGGHAPRGQAPPRAGGSPNPNPAGDNRLTLTNAVATERAAFIDVPASPNDLYTLSVEAQSWLQSGMIRAFLICLSAHKAYRAVAPDGAGATVANDGRWQHIEVAVLCPTGTQFARVDLRNSGRGTAVFRGITVRELRAAAARGA